MEVIYKKTTELTAQEVEQICGVFSQVFPGNTRTSTEFTNEFLNNEFGYSFHGVLMDDDRVVGSQSYIPFVYLIDGTATKACLSVDTMILEGFRNFDNIFDLWLKGHKELKNNGFSFVLGFPNENAYPLLIKGLKEKDIGDLSTYILPYKISSVKPRLKTLDVFSKLFSKILINLSTLSNDVKTKVYRIVKNREKFDTYRYKWFDGLYKHYKIDDLSAVYKIKNHQGVRTAFLVDVYPMNKKNFDKAVRHIYKTERSNFEIILYVGHLHFTPMSLIKIPKKYEPKTFHFTAKILDKNAIDSKVLYDVNNWDVNLSNYDLI